MIKLKTTHCLSPGGEGAEVVYPLRTSEELPKSILEAIGEEGQIMRKVYQRVLPEDPSKDYYYIMRETPNTTALLIEYGFIDNPRDIAKLENNLTDYAEAVVRAVSNYIGVQYISPDGTVGEGNTYTVKAGDTLYGIANSYGITVEELKTFNNLTSNNLRIGQVLRIPTITEDNENNNNPVTPPTSNDGTQYVVVLGDNLYSIARKFNVDVVDIINLNNLSSTVLTPGQVLLIPNGNTLNTTYIVKRGDTLYSIANSYGVTVDEIKKLNNLVSNTLSIGQELLIPTDNTITETNYEVYTVVPGDTLYGIANRYGVTVDEIKNFNNLTSNLLSVGQKLQIPIDTVTSSNFVYTVRRGDTLYNIANNFNVAVDDIRTLNNLNSNLLLVGQELLIPQK